ncbi:MAG: penicillin acylase family protein [Rhizobiaceae bacterium]
MRRLFKWLSGILGVLVLCVIIGGGMVYLVFTNTIPDDNGTFTLTGLEQEVSILRDKEGVPHIEAQSHADAAMGLGFAHAQDRLWQMEVLRMAGQGRLSELFGEATISSDTFLRTLDMASAARDSYELLKPQTKNIIESYVAGVNAYINRDIGKFSTKFPPEFLILGVTPEPWEPWHSGLIVKVMALTLDQNMGHEIKRLAMASKGFSPKEIESLVGYGPRDNPAPLPDLRNIYEFSAKQASNSPAKYTDIVVETGKRASNNWVISGSRTQSGKPILANDPHLGLTAPSMFYLTHLSFTNEDGLQNIIGGSLPGTPLILVGRNDSLAWGLTTTGVDSQDIFVERLDPGDNMKYLTPDGPKAFEVRTEILKTSKGTQVEIVVRNSRHGPILPGEYKNLENILPKNHVAALRWTALDHDDVTLDSVLEMTLTKTVDDFIESQRTSVSPMQSIVVADIEGNIGLIAPGRVPIRNDENVIQGRAPVPGWLAKYDWVGEIPFDDLPKIVNPASGAIATANANFLPSTYGQHITYDWAEHFRQARVEEKIIQTNEIHDIAKSISIMGDTRSEAMLRLRDIALDLVPGGVRFDIGMMAALKSWDGRMDKSSSEALIMMAWFKNLHKDILADDLGDEYELFKKGKITPLLRLLENRGTRDWCDRTDTLVKETCSEILAGSLAAALKEIAKAQGDDWQKWRWGNAHIALGAHRPFAKVGLLADLFNVSIESAGGPYTLRRGQTDFGEDKPFYSRHGSAYRAVYDFGDLNKSMFMQSTGQSGHFLSKNYRTFSERWADMKFIQMSTRREDYAEGAMGTWTLKPE